MSSGAEAIAAVGAYERFESIARLLDETPQGSPHSSTLYSLALRAALHPALLPYLTDPLRPIRGEYVSLDAQVAALCERGISKPEIASFALLTSEERLRLAAISPLPAGTEDMAGSITAVGALWGAIYVPSLSAAVPCRVVAALDSSRVPQDSIEGWKAPICVRPGSTSTQLSAERALRAAVLLLCSSGRLPPELLPAPVYFDICGPDISDDLLAGLEGDSLDLAFALAFLSALTGETLAAGTAATGALIPSGLDKFSIGPVGWVPQKLAAVQRAAGDKALLIAPSQNGKPHAIDSIVPTADLLMAAEYVIPSLFATNRHVPELTAETENYALASRGLICVLPPETANGGPEEAAQELRDRILRGTIRRCGGEVFVPARSDSSALYAVFADSGAAVRASLAVSQTARCIPWPADISPARVLPATAVNSGPIERIGAAWIGDAIDQTERIAEVCASPCGVLVSAAARESFASALKGPIGKIDSESAEVRFTPLGSHRLRDLRPPISLFSVTLTATAARTDRRSLSPSVGVTLSMRPNNLPVQALPLFGREEDRATLRRLLLDPAARIVTLTGPGGCGKTRLALEAAAACTSSFDGGSYLVPLEEARGAEDAAGVISGVLGLDPSPSSRTMADAVLADLSAPRPRTLLILDGADGGGDHDPSEGEAERSIPSFITDLLRIAPDLVCIAARRTPLLVSGETVFPVRPLASPPEGILDDNLRNSVIRSPTGGLFLARSRMVSPGFAPIAPADWAALADICRRLASSPLALMLAASQIGSVSLPGIAARFGGGPAFEAIWSLLTVGQRQLLERLSCFSDGFAPDSACTLMPADTETVTETLAALEEKFLVQRSGSLAGSANDTSDTIRYHLPPPVREFARRRLAVSGDEAVARDAHARCFESLSMRMDSRADTRRENAAFDRLESEMGNLRAALGYLRMSAPERAPNFIYHLTDFLHYRGHLREWRDWPPYALRLITMRRLSVRDAVRSHLHWCCAVAALESDDTESGEMHQEDALHWAESAGDGRAIADALSIKGACRARTGEWIQAALAYNEALSHYRSVGGLRGEVTTLNGLGLVALRSGDLTAAFERYSDVTRLCRRIEDRRGLAIALNNLGFVAAQRAEFGIAARQFEAYLGLCRELRDTRGLATGLLNLAEARTLEGHRSEAVPVFALAETVLGAFRIPQTESLRDEVQRLRNVIVTDGDTDRYADLLQHLARLTLASLLTADPTDPLAPPQRRLWLEPVRLLL